MKYGWAFLLPLVFWGIDDAGNVGDTSGPKFSIEVMLEDELTGEPIRGAEIAILNTQTLETLVAGTKTDADGSAHAEVSVSTSFLATQSHWVDPAFPNPVPADNHRVTIGYIWLGEFETRPTLELFDVLGRPVDLKRRLPAGTYFYRLRLQRGVVTRVQSIALTAPGRPEFNLVPRSNGDLLDAYARNDGVGRIAVQALVVARGNDYAQHEQTVDLSSDQKLTLRLPLTRSDRVNRHRAEVFSPDGRNSVQLTIQDHLHQKDCLFYRVLRDGTPIIQDSRLGLDLTPHEPIGCGLAISARESNSVADLWTPPYGQNETILDTYNSVSIEVTEPTDKGRKIAFDVRAYDEGIAFRYRIDRDSGIRSKRITGEHTTIRFPDGAMAYAQYGHEGSYVRSPTYSILKRCEHPLTVELPGKRFASFAEANNTDFPLMWLEPDINERGSLQVGLRGAAELDAGRLATPWRVVLLGDRPTDLIEHAYLLENLSEPSRLRDTEWVLPGKAVRVFGNSTEAALSAVDFAAERNIRYVHFDAGWYGNERFEHSDAASPIPGLDMDVVVDYAAARNMGIFLYVNHRALKKQLQEILPLYKQWGIRGIKAGFVEVGSQRQTRWLHEMVRSAADYGLLVNVHDAYRPAGYSRTYPNLLTQEGLRGNEHMPGAGHNTMLPFTRFLIGAGDYAIAYNNENLTTSYSHQLALAVVFYSPLQYLYWAEAPGRHSDNGAAEFWGSVPTVWDETRALNGRIGEYVTMARRSGEEWFVGSITNESPRMLEVRLDFLDPGRSYLARIYQDDVEIAGKRTPVVRNEREVDSSTILQLMMAGSGGQAIHIVPRR